MTPKDPESLTINTCVISSLRLDCYELRHPSVPLRNTCTAGHEFLSSVMIAACEDFKAMITTHPHAAHAGNRRGISVTVLAAEVIDRTFTPSPNQAGVIVQRLKTLRGSTHSLGPAFSFEMCV